jgi:hypothetical protein
MTLREFHDIGLPYNVRATASFCQDNLELQVREMIRQRHLGALVELEDAGQIQGSIFRDANNNVVMRVIVGNEYIDEAGPDTPTKEMVARVQMAVEFNPTAPKPVQRLVRSVELEQQVLKAGAELLALHADLQQQFLRPLLTTLTPQVLSGITTDASKYLKDNKP